MCICVCMYVCPCVHLRMRLCVSLCVHVCLRVCPRVRLCVHVYLCVHVCESVCASVCVCVCGSATYTRCINAADWRRVARWKLCAGLGSGRLRANELGHRSSLSFLPVQLGGPEPPGLPMARAQR